MAGKNLAELAIDAGLEPTPENAADVVFDIIRGRCYSCLSCHRSRGCGSYHATSCHSDRLRRPSRRFRRRRTSSKTIRTFARVLGLYVRERKILSLEEAIRKMSSQSARRLGIHDRGLITKGYFADIAIFDPDEIIDKATFENPHQYAIGTKFVLVNGTVVVENGQHTGARPGRILHGPGYFPGP